MAVVTPSPSMGERVGSMRFHGMSSPSSRSSRSGIMDEPVSRLIEEKIYVAVDKQVARSKSTLIWALQNTGGKKICLIHVHQPAQMIPVMGAKFPISAVTEEEVRDFREKEREKVNMILNDYLRICQQRGVRAEKMFIETDSVENGLVRLITELGIRKLVMGAAADRHHSKRMTDLKSRKAIFVCREAPALCQIWFTCKGYLIHTREAANDDAESVYASPRPSISSSDLLQALSSPESEHEHMSRVHSTDSVPHLVHNRSSTEHSGMVSDGSLNTEEGEIEFDGSGVTRSAPVLNTPEQNSGRSSSSNLQDGVDVSFYDKIRQAKAETHSSKREAFEESLRRQKSEKNALDAIRRAKQAEIVYSEELKRRKDTEIAVAKEKERLITIKREQEVVMEELQSAMDQRALLENQITESDSTMQVLKQKINVAVDLLQKLRDEREDLQTERDRALREAERLRKSRTETSTQPLPQYFTDISFSEIEEATNQFDSTLKIGEGGYGSIYIGILRHTQVAIKLLNPNSSQGHVEYQHEVDVLSKMRHPNIITLIGACPEGWSLVYEYLPGGSLEDRLNCKDNSSPLSWQNRVRIATEICASLVFLHSNKPHSIVHGDLKPGNILLDANLVSKLSDFGTCSLVHPGNNHASTDVTGTLPYLDPETSSSRELTPKSDIYSFGIILLRLLTGRPALRITNEVKYAIDSGTLNNLLDPLAGDWPFFQAEQLTRLALRCCEVPSENRPDLATEVWRVLEPMRASSGGSSSFHLGRNEHRIAPPYFICPIFQEVMQDPHVAADGFTYEAEAIRAWLDSEHDTSPMTNAKLSHTSLIANHALRSAIQEWLQHHW